MEITGLILAQLTDPFRIGLLAALVITTVQTSAHTRMVVPLLLGIVFVAVLIAMTTGRGEASQAAAIAGGIVANGVIVAVLLGLLALWRRLSKSNAPRP